MKRMLDTSVDSRGLIAPRHTGATILPSNLSGPKTSYAYSKPPTVGIGNNYRPMHPSPCHPSVVPPFQPSSIPAGDFQNRAPICVKTKTPASLPTTQQPPCSPIQLPKRARHDSPTSNVQNNVNSSASEKANDHVDSEDDQMVDNLVADNKYMEPDISDSHEFDASIEDAKRKDASGGKTIYLSEVASDVSFEAKMWRNRKFASKESLHTAVKNWHAQNHVKCKVLASSYYKWIVKCTNDDCNWRLDASISSEGNQFEVTDYSGPHSCINAIPLNHHYVCQRILPALREKVTMSLVEIQELVQRELHVGIGYEMAWQARAKALQEVYGSEEQSFKDFRQFVKALVVSNPGTIVQFDSDIYRKKEQFKRVFWSFGPSVHGYQFCLPVLSVDGTRLKGRYPGWILIAIGYDGNNGLFPLAFAIVENECQATWQWFLQCVASQVSRCDGLCIISKRTPELKEAVRIVFPPESGHSHRFCLRHMQSEMFSAGFKDDQLLSLFYTAGCALTKGDFEERMQRILEMNSSAYDWILSEEDFKHWALSYDDGQRFGYMTTNFYECQNFFLKKCLGLPIIPLVNMIFLCVKRIFDRKHTKAQEWQEQRLTPGVEETLARMKEGAGSHDVECNGFPSYLVTDNGGNRYEVKWDFEAPSCRCCYTRLHHIPCSHILALFNERHTDHRGMISIYYNMPHYRQAYSVLLYPIPNQRFWPHYIGPVMIPPSTLRPLSKPSSKPVHGSDSR